jgi:hypothetical protein
MSLIFLRLAWINIGAVPKSGQLDSANNTFGGWGGGLKGTFTPLSLGVSGYIVGKTHESSWLGQERSLSELVNKLISFVQTPGEKITYESTYDFVTFLTINVIATVY